VHVYTYPQDMYIIRMCTKHMYIFNKCRKTDLTQQQQQLKVWSVG